MKTATEFKENYSNSIIAFNLFLHDRNYQGNRERLGIEVTEMLYKLLQKWSTANNTFEFWRKVESKDFVHIIFIHADDEIMDIHLEIGINKDGIHLEMGIASPGNLPLMPDEFWQQSLELNRYGNFEVTGNEAFHDKDKEQYPELINAPPGNLFRLMQKLIVFPMLHDGPIELGNMSVVWPFDQYSITDVEEKGALAFESMHSLNKWLFTTVQKS